MKLYFAALLTLTLSTFAQETRPWNFNEVMSLVRSNLTDISEDDLNRAAAIGLINQLGTKVQLVTNATASAQSSDEPLSRRAVYENGFGYVQIRSVDARLPDEFQKWLSSSTNSGLILDLRYARGEDYSAAARVADQFVKGGEPLLKVGSSDIRSTDDSPTVETPVAVLVNKETSGAAEALAALLRATHAGLIIGSNTAGEARVFELFNLSSGQQLKIGTVPVLVSEKPISSKGLTPDIVVALHPGAEKVLYQDPYRQVSAITGQVLSTSANGLAGSTNRSRRFNEAELVRRHRAGNAGDTGTPEPEDPEEPIINDPVLARALDFLKGISALQQQRPL